MGGRAINVPHVESTALTGIVERLEGFERVVEVGIGRRTDLAAALLAAGVAVTATDVVERSVPDGARFVGDDVTDPDPDVYADAGAIVACNLPPELHGPTLALAERVGAAFAFTTLGTDPPAVPVEPETVGDGTLFWARGRPTR